MIRAGYGMSADPNQYHFLRNAYPSTITTDPVGSSTGTPPEISLTGTNATGPFGPGGAITTPPGLAGRLAPTVLAGSAPPPPPR